MVVNQDGDEVIKRVLTEWDSITLDEMQHILFMLLSRLNLEVVRTNATKSCKFEIELRGV